jgi:TonB family protein
MPLSLEQPGGRPLTGRTANDRLKAGGPARLHRSIIASVLMHVGIVAGWPQMDLPTLDASGAGAAPIRLVTLGGISAPAQRVELAPSVPVPTPEPEVAEAAAPTAGTDDEDDGGTGTPPMGWEGRRSELWRLAGLEAGLAPPSTPPEDAAPAEDADEGEELETSEGTEDAGVSIRQRTEELEYQQLTEEERLSLERLSALRPELVLASPSSWLVLRNPDEVAMFLRSRLQRQVGDLAPNGSLAVSLWVDERGSVEWAEINRSSGRGQVDETALELFREVVAFRPARENGVRVPVAAIFWLMW